MDEEEEEEENEEVSRNKKWIKHFLKKNFGLKRKIEI